MFHSKFYLQKIILVSHLKSINNSCELWPINKQYLNYMHINLCKPQYKSIVWKFLSDFFPGEIKFLDNFLQNFL